MNNPFDELEEKLRFPVMAISAAGWTKTPEEVDDLTEASADDDLNEWQYLEIYDSAGMRFVARRAYRGWPQGILAAFICRLLDHVVHVALELDDGTAVSVDELRRKLMALGEFEEDFRTAASHRDLIEASQDLRRAESAAGLGRTTYKRLERTRHNGAFIHSCVGEPLKRNVIRLMIAFKVELNGESLGTAGADDLSVLTAIVSAVGKLGPNSTGAFQREHHCDIELAVGGLTSPRAGDDFGEHLDWVKRTLKPGDVISVSVVEAVRGDTPIGSMPKPADGDYQKLYEQLSTNAEETDDE